MDEEVSGLVTTVALAVIIAITGCVVVSVAHVVDRSDVQTIYPLGDESYSFFTNAFTGTEFTMTISGVSKDESGVEKNVTGTCTVKVIDCKTSTDGNPDTISYHVKIELDRDGVKLTNEYDRTDVPRTDKVLLISYNDFYPANGDEQDKFGSSPSADIKSRWGAHHLDVDNRKDSTQYICYYTGIDDRVCYAIQEVFDVNETNGSSYRFNVTYLLDKMNFVPMTQGVSAASFA